VARWSKLQKQLHELFDPALDLQVQCRVVRMQSQYGSTNLPRYWLTLEKEVIWDYPGDFSRPGGTTVRVDGTAVLHYPHQTDISAISSLIREYIDTPARELMSRQFAEDHWGLANILRAADRRIGVRQWAKLKRKLHNQAALKVLAARSQRSNSSIEATSSGKLRLPTAAPHVER
jgi:hypothetical protein